MLVDIDRVGSPKEPASAEEIAAAKQLADEIAFFLTSRGWPEPWRVMSGNGFHLYFSLLGVENTEANTNRVRSVLRGLASRFDNGVVAVDTTVFNASRITKVPGTLMRKGLEVEGRPYRTAVICDGE